MAKGTGRSKLTFPDGGIGYTPAYEQSQAIAPLPGFSRQSLHSIDQLDIPVPQSLTVWTTQYIHNFPHLIALKR